MGDLFKTKECPIQMIQFNIFFDTIACSEKLYWYGAACGGTKYSNNM